jgi:hypothetical protein
LGHGLFNSQELRESNVTIQYIGGLIEKNISFFDQAVTYDFNTSYGRSFHAFGLIFRTLLYTVELQANTLCTWLLFRWIPGKKFGRCALASQYYLAV